MEENYTAVPNSPHGPQSVAYPIVEPLEKTRGWALFLSILGFIISGLMILGGLFFIAAGIFGGYAAGSGSLSSSGSGSVSATPAAFGGVILGVMGAVYIVISLFYLIPSLWLFRYASRIQELVRTRSELDLIAALHAQKSFWKFVGIMILATIALNLGLVAVVFIGGFASSFAV